MSIPPTQLPWEQPGWFEEASTWIRDQLARRGISITSPPEILHQRPWSTFARVLTDEAIVYFKATSPYDRFEAALTQALAHWRPDLTAPILGVDLDQGWLLTADAGETLRARDRSPRQVEHWLKILPLYADFQIEMARRVPEFLAMGVPDRRLSSLPNQFNRLLEHSENLRTGQDPGLSTDEHRQLLDLRPRFAAECAHLASYNLPETLTHEELTEVNVLMGDGRYIFTDWSEGSITHPFFSTLTTIRTLAYWLGLDEFGPEVAKARDASLEPWTKFETRRNINAAFRLAFRLAMANRAISWDLGTGSLEGKHKEPYADSVPGWLQDFLQVEKAALDSEAV